MPFIEKDAASSSGVYNYLFASFNGTLLSTGRVRIDKMASSTRAVLQLDPSRSLDVILQNLVSKHQSQRMIYVEMRV
jgi:hypothetical protein